MGFGISMENFDRLEMQAKGGLLKLSDVGSYIAQNLKRDPDSKVSVAMVADLLAQDLARIIHGGVGFWEVSGD
jgi:hypothetical protein